MVDPLQCDDSIWRRGCYRSTTRSNGTATSTIETAVRRDHAQPRATDRSTGTANRKTEGEPHKNQARYGIGSGTQCQGGCSRSGSGTVRSGRGEVPRPTTFGTDP